MYMFKRNMKRSFKVSSYYTWCCYLSDVFIPAKVKTNTWPKHRCLPTTSQQNCSRHSLASLFVYQYPLLWLSIWGENVRISSLVLLHKLPVNTTCDRTLAFVSGKVILKRSHWCGYETLHSVLAVNWSITWSINVIQTPLRTHIPKTISASLVHMTRLPICFPFQYIIVLYSVMW
jgi:hypothetical protein